MRNGKGVGRAIVADQLTNPAGLKGEALWRWQVQARQQALEEQRRAEAAKRAQAAATLRRQPSDIRDDGFHPLEMAKDAFDDFQHGPKIERPNLVESFIPVVGPAWEAAADLQDGNYGGAAFNTAMAVADVLPIGVAAKGIKAAKKGIGILKNGSVTAGAAKAMLKSRGMVKAGEEIHHTVPLDGVGRSVQDWRNHYAFLKPLPREIHRRIHGRFNGKPRFDPIRRIWYGTTDWMKAVPTGLVGYAADAWENMTHPFDAGAQPRPSEPPPSPRPRRGGG